MQLNQQEEIFSMRIVSVDHYMNKPIPELDSWYSEFRGSDIKKVPIIRLFGSTINGDKLCAHIHGVHPYLYIPYDGGNMDVLNCDKYMYQIAASLDKAINISVGNAQSPHQHVFKISLVKGIPYYGYHAGEHQFLKIYLYNPYHLKRAANLFQNGAILGKSYQTYETHLPYLLQFFIDYNLYGMSILHVRRDGIILRNGDDENGVEKMSVSDIELDFRAPNILNRLVIDCSQNSEHANPGIQSIWNDERRRREILQIPAIEIPPSQIPFEIVTESDIFYRDALKNKLKLLKEDENSNFAETETNAKNIVRNRAVLITDVYPSECTDNSQNIMEASVILDHTGNNNLNNKTDISMMEHQILNNALFNETIVDEDIILSMSQKSNGLDDTLRDEDRELLEIMRRLEENTNDIENDSILAPLTQTKSGNEILSQISNNANLNKSQFLEQTLINGEDPNDSDDEDHLNDFTLLLNDDTDILTNGSTLNETDVVIDQLDGIVEINALAAKRKCDILAPSRRSNRLRHQNRYNQLDINIKTTTRSLPRQPRRNLLIVEQGVVLKKMVIVVKRCDSDMEMLMQNCSNKSSKDSLALSREYDRKNNFYPVAGPSNYDYLNSIADVDVPPDNFQDETSVEEEPIRPILHKRNKIEAIVTSEDVKEEGNTHGADIDAETLIHESTQSPKYKRSPEIITIQDDEDDNETQIHSFYDKTIAFDTSHSLVTSDEEEIVEILPKRAQPNLKIVITLKESPPIIEDYDEILKKYSIPKEEHVEPFYGDYNDVGTKKEVGHTVLHIPGKSLNTCEEFKSVLGDNFQGIVKWRNKKFTELLGDGTDNNDLQNPNQIREVLSMEKHNIIAPFEMPPTLHEAKVWLKARETVRGVDNYNSEENEDNLDDDIPLTIRREKIRIGAALNGSPNSKQMKDSDDESDNDVICVSPTTRYSSIHDRVRLSAMKTSLISPSGSQTPINSNKRKLTVRKSLLSNFKDYSRKKQKEHNGSPNLLTLSASSSPCSLRNVDDIFEQLKSSQQSNHSDSSSHTMDSVTENSIRKLIDKSSFIANLNGSDTQSMNASFGITGHSNGNSNGFKVQLENLQDAKALNEFNFLTLLTIELHIQCRGDLKPDPDIDPVSAIFYTIMNDVPENHKLPILVSGVLMVKHKEFTVKSFKNMYSNRFKIDIVDTELELLDAFVKFIRLWDPDIFAGYEIEMSSWGYLIERGYILERNFIELLSRTPDVKNVQFVKEEEEDTGRDAADVTPQLKIIGRILLDIWRLLRHEIALTSYSFENIMYHILHKRCPLHSHRLLTQMWYKTSTIWIVFDYFFERVCGCIEILKQLDLIGRTCELAKLFGIQFYEVLSRGSQYRVESMMLRIAKPRNFISVSPSQNQKVNMRAPEYLPLILEPQSRFYADPLIVLDFQSLYPSIIIAYNLCYSTCLGRVEHLGQTVPFELGASQLKVDPARLQSLIDSDSITASPSGVIFVKKSIREGILPRMLREILDTRIMVKQSMKIHKSNNILQRVLHARQLGLKLMANVTYGYTSANFSGRMPCVDIADTVLGKSRETLERAIKVVEANEKWQAKVVYGDTDSLFVLLPGRSKDEAFKIGEEIAATITKDNPPPVKLKMEKVYHPCILQTKKRYVGFMYETPDQKDPVYEAKGIETVRRDGCPAVAKILEKTLRILFQSCDVSQVKRYVCRQFTKIMSGKANIQDFIFAKEFRGLTGYRPTACVPALELTRKWKQVDKRNEPRRGERVPFIIVNGPPGFPLIRLVRSPHDVLSDDGLKINATYYITKAIIPPLNRCLLLIGADVHQWFADLPRKVTVIPSVPNDFFNSRNNKAKKSTISQYFSTTNCAADCGEQTMKGICKNCMANPQKAVTTIADKIAKMDRKYELMKQICQSCCGRVHEIQCRSLDCPVLFVSKQIEREFLQIEYFRNLLHESF